MDELSSTTDRVLQFCRPRCGQNERDEYEVLSAAIPTEWRCGSCSRTLGVLMCECDFCGAENVSVALTTGALPATNCVNCRHCGQRCVHHEEAE